MLSSIWLNIRIVEFKITVMGDFLVEYAKQNGGHQTKFGKLVIKNNLTKIQKREELSV